MEKIDKLYIKTINGALSVSDTEEFGLYTLGVTEEDAISKYKRFFNKQLDLADDIELIYLDNDIDEEMKISLFSRIFNWLVNGKS